MAKRVAIAACDRNVLFLGLVGKPVAVLTPVLFEVWPGSNGNYSHVVPL